MASADNSKKAQNGVKAKLSVETAISELQSIGVIVDRKKRFRVGYKGYSADQFYSPAVVELVTGEKLLLFSTHSVRSDRVKEQQWDAFNIKQIDHGITRAFLLVPGPEAFDQGTTARDNIRGGNFFSAIDDIMTVDEFTDRVLEYTSKAYQASIEAEEASYDSTADESDNDAVELEMKDVVDPKACVILPAEADKQAMSDAITRGADQLKSKGSVDDYVGKKFENVFAAILDNDDNMNRYLGKGNTEGYMYDIYEQVMRYLGVPKKGITKVSATTRVPKLPNRGEPKADVVCAVEFNRKQYQKYTFSAKNTGQKHVSVHQYTADAFADVLDSKDAELRRLLNEFQSAGNMKNMPKGDAQKLSAALAPHREKLDRWVFSGEGAAGVSSDQCAQFFVTHDKNTGRITLHTAEDYWRALERNNNGKSGFGTIFHWTYPHNKRGKYIQLKAPIK